jgi:opacity protein-like surface antigen
MKLYPVFLLACLAQVLSHTNAHAAEEAMGFTGVYAGASAGFLVNGQGLTAHHAGFTQLDGACDSNGEFLSFAPSAQIGFTYELQSKVVLGLEADFSYNVNQSGRLACRCPTNVIVNDSFTSLNRLQGSLRARIGYAMKDSTFLPFVILGGSLADLGLSYSNEINDSYSAETARMGWLVGAGLEWKLARAWSLRAEYQFVAYTSINLEIPTIYSLTDPAGSANANFYANQMRFAVSYWF